MKFYEKKYVGYKPERDVLYVFGAGASISDGGPLQKDLLRQILEQDNSSSSPLQELSKFLSDNFDLSKGNYPSLESVFGYLDHFISKGESLGENQSTFQLLAIKEFLIKCIHKTISTTRSKNGV